MNTHFVDDLDFVASDKDLEEGKNHSHSQEQALGISCSLLALPGVLVCYDNHLNDWFWCSRAEVAEDTGIESMEEDCKPPPSKKCEDHLNTGVCQS